MDNDIFIVVNSFNAVRRNGGTVRVKRFLVRTYQLTGVFLYRVYMFSPCLCGYFWVFFWFSSRKTCKSGQLVTLNCS